MDSSPGVRLRLGEVCLCSDFRIHKVVAMSHMARFQALSGIWKVPSWGESCNVVRPADSDDTRAAVSCAGRHKKNASATEKLFNPRWDWEQLFSGIPAKPVANVVSCGATHASTSSPMASASLAVPLRPCGARRRRPSPNGFNTCLQTYLSISLPTCLPFLSFYVFHNIKHWFFEVLAKGSLLHF